MLGFREGDRSIKLAKDIAALKAVSQNLMHSNLSITDGVYGILSVTDIQNQIASLGSTAISGENKKELESLISELIHQTFEAG
jgi:hypothetical protein